MDTLPALLRTVAAELPDRPAVVAETTLTWRELCAAVRLRAAEYADLGVRPGDRVGLWAPNSADWVVASLAVSYVGATLVPLNTRYRAREVHDILQRTEARLLVLASGFLDRDQLAELRELPHPEAPGPVIAALPRLSAVIELGGPPAPATEDQLAAVDRQAHAVRPDSVADIMFTSGTTGRPKGVVTTHAQTVATARAWSSGGEVSAADRYLVISPFFHTYGYKVGIVTALLHGCALYPMATFDPAAALALIGSAQITMLPGAPAIFTTLMATPHYAPAALSSLRMANTGAANVPASLIHTLLDEVGVELVMTAFGMTECGIATMTRRGDPGDLVAQTCGQPVDGVEVRIADPETGADTPVGTEGELRLRGPMVMREYLDDPVATAAAFDADGWFCTGDIARVDEHGYLTITDRLKDMYICGGFNVYPAEVEQALAELPDILDVAVIGVPESRLGEVGQAFVVRRAGTGLTEAAVIAFARDRIANFKVPRSVVFIEALPRNLAGKVLKNELRSLQ